MSIMSFLYNVFLLYKIGDLMRNFFFNFRTLLIPESNNNVGGFIKIRHKGQDIIVLISATEYFQTT